MEIEVMMPSPAVDFNFSSTSTSPYATAPSSPQRFGNFYFSAPTSPTRASSFFRDFSLPNPNTATVTADEGNLSTIPFDWEDKPGTPKPNEGEEDTDFAFDFSGQLETPSLSAADELFDGGKIKPLKPPPRLQYAETRVGDSPRSPKSPKSPKAMFKEALSPRHKKKDFDPFSEAIKQTVGAQNPEATQRGRERTQNPSNPRRQASRSLSPFSVSDVLFEEENNDKITSKNSSSFSSATWYSKWKLKDFLLFRSASEGSATARKDPLKKYAMLKKVNSDEVKNSSFRSTDSGGSSMKNSNFRSTESGGSSVGGSSRGRGGRRVSAHELHYTSNRAVAEDMRRKTYLPYKHGLFGCLGIQHGIPRDFGPVIRRD